VVLVDDFEADQTLEDAREVVEHDGCAVCTPFEDNPLVRVRVRV